jgi:hypothetical protein
VEEVHVKDRKLGIKGIALALQERTDWKTYSIRGVAKYISEARAWLREEILTVNEEIASIEQALTASAVTLPARTPTWGALRSPTYLINRQGYLAELRSLRRRTKTR